MGLAEYFYSATNEETLFYYFVLTSKYLLEDRNTVGWKLIMNEDTCFDLIAQRKT